jgi:hypothetical protein
MSEEKKVNAEVSDKKLSYEELQSYAQNMSQQAEVMGQEIQKLRMALQRQGRENFYQEVHFAFKVIENSDKFSPEFVRMTINRIEEIMTPAKEEEKKNNPENKE